MNRLSSAYLNLFLLITIAITVILIVSHQKSNENYSYKPVKFVGNPALSGITIQIIIVIDSMTNLNFYQDALNTVKCYAKIHNYHFRIVKNFEFLQECPQKDNNFRRHCVVVQLLYEADYTLLIDVDMGVVNPNRKIEEYIDSDKDITFYDRFSNHGVMVGSYLVRNTDWSQKFLNDFANYEYRLPSIRGTDEEAIHIYLLEVIFPNRSIVYENCLDIYSKSQNDDDLIAFESCCRSIMGIGEDFGQIKILRKGHGWSRDNWLTNSKWSPERDFIMQGWRATHLIKYDTLPVPIDATSQKLWHNPLNVSIDLDKCVLGNTTWNYDLNLIEDPTVIQAKLDRMFREEQKNHFKMLSHMAKRLGYD